MKTSSIIRLIAAAPALMLCSCSIVAEKSDISDADAKFVDRTFKVGSFKSIETSTVVNFKISQGNKTSLSLRAPSNLIDYITVKVEDGVLRVDAKKGKRFHNPGDKFNMTVTVPTLNAITTTGTGDIKFSGKFKTGDFKATSSGTGDIDMPDFLASDLYITSTGTGDVDFNGSVNSASITSSGTGDVEFTSSKCERLTGTTSGTGDIELKGSASYAELYSYGTGDIKARRFSAAEVNATTSGTGDIDCTATRSFKGSAGGTGEIIVYGNPAVRTSETKRIKYMK